MRLYIAGPMTGLPELNYPAFHEAEAQLVAAGFDVLSPAHNSGKADDWAGYMRLGIAQLIQCDGVALLPGSHNSRGARVERQLAEELGMRVAAIDSWLES